MNEFKDRLIRMFIMGFRQMQDPYYQGFAAQVSFYFILSIVPIMILIVQILGLFNISMGTAVNLIYDYTGQQVSGLMNSLFEFSSIGLVSVIYIIIALWAGSRASFALTRIANYTLTEGSSTGRNYFVERVRAIGTLFITVSTVVFSIVILCYGQLILTSILSLLGQNPHEYVDSIWMWLRWPLGFLLYFGMIGFNFYMLPTKRKPFRKVIPGTIFAAVGMLVVTALYSKYASSLANYDIVYGALSSVVALLIWFFFLAWVLLLGVLFNKVWEDTSEPFTKRRPPEHLMWEHAWVPSKFDTDPKEFRLRAIKDILTGDDVLEVEVEEPIRVQWSPAEKAEATAADKSKVKTEAETGSKTKAEPETEHESASEPEPETAPADTATKTHPQMDRKQRRRTNHP